MLWYYRASGQYLYRHSDIFRASERNFAGACISLSLCSLSLISLFSFFSVLYFSISLLYLSFHLSYLPFIYLYSVLLYISTELSDIVYQGKFVCLTLNQELVYPVSGFELKQKSKQFLQQLNVKKCPSSIPYRDSNPWPSDCAFHPITTRPGLPTVWM